MILHVAATERVASSCRVVYDEKETSPQRLCNVLTISLPNTEFAGLDNLLGAQTY